MKKKILIFTMTIFLAQLAICQVASDQQQIHNNKTFTGAVAHKKEYKAIYQLDSNDPKTVEKAIRNINNVLEDPRLKGKLTIELIAFSGGTEVFLKKEPKYENAIKSLISKGVIVAQCTNSLKERNLTKEELFDFVAYVPSGNGELIIRANDGWTIVKP